MTSSRLELPAGNRAEAVQPGSGFGSGFQGPLRGEVAPECSKQSKGINMSSNTLAAPKATPGFDVNAHFRSVMNELGLNPEDTGGTITFVGEDPIFPSVHRLWDCISIPILAGAAGIANILRQRAGHGQALTLDVRKAIQGINPMYKFMPTINGYPHQLPYFIGNPMGFDLYRTKDGRFFLPTGAYPRLLNSMCTFLGCSPAKDSIA